MYVVCMCVFVGAYVSLFVSFLQLLCMYVCVYYCYVCTTTNSVVCSVHAFSHPTAVRIYVISRSCHHLAQALKADV